MGIRLITLTGVSGAGKGAILKRLMESHPAQFAPVTSTTTRDPRNSDLTGEYECVAPETFEAYRRQGAFLWSDVVVAGKHYGSRRQNVNAFVLGWGNLGPIGVMTLVPSAVPRLRTYLDEIEKSSTLASFYILSPPESVLHTRLLKRGDPPNEIDDRIAECRGWDAEARASFGAYGAFIRNDDEYLPGLAASREIIEYVLAPRPARQSR